MLVRSIESIFPPKPMLQRTNQIPPFSILIFQIFSHRKSARSIVSSHLQCHCNYCIPRHHLREHSSSPSILNLTMRTSFLLSLLSILLVSIQTNATSHTFSLASSSSSFLKIPRGGANNNSRLNRRRRPGNYDSFLGWREALADAKASLTSFTERKTFFSTQLMPKSDADAEWAAFLKGWLLVSLPIPLPLMFVALVAYSTLMSFSLWDDSIKRKYIIGLYHGVLVFAVLLREMEEKIEEITHPRQVMILLNVAISLFLGKVGKFKPTKFLMDTTTFGVLFYILYQYFDTSSTGNTVGSWYR